MISFDRKTGNVNLTPIWDEINSIKSDTSSLYTMITAGGGGVIPEELLNSITLLNSNTGILSSDITLLNNNTLYFNNELYSLKTDTSTIANDTVSLNMDVVSLYNICSSLSDSISTITGGGGGGDGKYYLALSDAVNSSLSFVYNMTGDIASIPYNSVNFFGNLDNFTNYSIPSTINKLTISNIKTISSITFSNSAANSSIRSSNRISFGGEYFANNSFKNLGYLTINCETLLNNTFYSIVPMSINCATISSCIISSCSANLIASTIRNCTLSFFGKINGVDLRSNKISEGYTINAISISENTLSSLIFPVLNANYIYGNKITSCLIQDFYCSKFGNNEVAMKTDCHVVASSISENNFHQITTNNKIFDVELKADVISRNVFSHVRNISLSGLNYTGLFAYEHVKGIYLYDFTTIAQTYNIFNDIGIFDVHNLTIPVNAIARGMIGIQTMRLNYNWKWSFTNDITNIQPTNIYTIDFYNCDPWIVNSVFHIPSYYSGYDVANIWISGKPIVDYSYSLSTTTF